MNASMRRAPRSGTPRAPADAVRSLGQLLSGAQHPGRPRRRPGRVGRQLAATAPGGGAVPEPRSAARADRLPPRRGLARPPSDLGHASPSGAPRPTRPSSARRPSSPARPALGAGGSDRVHLAAALQPASGEVIFAHRASARPTALYILPRAACVETQRRGRHLRLRRHSTPPTARLRRPGPAARRAPRHHPRRADRVHRLAPARRALHALAAPHAGPGHLLRRHRQHRAWPVARSKSPSCRTSSRAWPSTCTQA